MLPSSAYDDSPTQYNIIQCNTLCRTQDYTNQMSPSSVYDDAPLHYNTT